jgi:glycosyltransferase involved in cell wall biosynthesis
MTSISGFTFGHNLIDSGYPIVEAIRAIQSYVDEIVFVDMQSTDNTREVLDQLAEDNASRGSYMDILGLPRHYPPIKILEGFWGNQAGETLRQAHSKHIECSGDIIVHFEADEVFDYELIQGVIELIENGQTDIAVYRLQIETNFQRCRWYPEPVHRVFPRLSNTRKEGHTTNRHAQAFVIGPENGYLWDITNSFRDNWINRVNKQAELRNTNPQYLMTPIHALHKVELTEAEAHQWLFSGRHWTWTETPFNIPEILRPLVGVTRYEPKV